METHTDQSQHTFVDELNAAFQGKCPRCHEGEIFPKRSTVMNKACPKCDLKLDREYGYFTGAMYFSYAMGMPILIANTVLAWNLLPKSPLYVPLILAWVAFLPFVIPIFRYSRIFWIYFERYIDPIDT